MAQVFGTHKFNAQTGVCDWPRDAALTLTSARDDYDDVGYGGCAGKPDGNYLHPTDCTRFITCHNGRAADMACPDCGLGNNPYQCAGQEYMYYNPKMDMCAWPSTTPCITGQTA